MYRVTKRYGHDLGFSCVFRQPLADGTHCRFLHGYALGFELVFECEDNERDARGWVMNFGGLKAFKAWLGEMFDHTTVICKDDPAIGLFRDMNGEKGLGPQMKPQLIQLREVDAVGCEAFAKLAYDKMVSLMKGSDFADYTRTRLVSVTCSEHGANSATYVPWTMVSLDTTLDAAGGDVQVIREQVEEAVAGYIQTSPGGADVQR